MARRAVLSVADKTGIQELARGLTDLGWEIISTGGTYRFLKSAEIPVREVSDVTGFPEILDGRVKTLHPAIHGGILANREIPEHVKAIGELGIFPIDMVVCNLYPFVQTVSRPNVPIEEVIEQIDIGGPTMLRAAAKNFRSCIVVCNPSRYAEVLTELRTNGDVSEVTRRNLAVEVFAHTAAYDSAISQYLGSLWNNWPISFPEEISFGFTKSFELRYGENPHQKACFYQRVLGSFSLQNAQIQGKELSYNNINDSEGALATLAEFGSDSPACVIVKHAAPCGVALGKTAGHAFSRAFEGDPVSAFGGIVALNVPVDEACASQMSKIFLEVVIAPDYTPEALKVLSAKKDLRLLRLPPKRVGLGAEYTIRPALGGILLQECDHKSPFDEEWRVVSKRQPTPEEIADLRFAMAVCKHVRSNAIVFARDSATVGIGGGQPNRVDSVRIAAARAGEKARGAVMASDAFFPFPDSVEEAARAGITAIAHPGGSKKDDESIRAADEAGMAMMITGTRHFYH